MTKFCGIIGYANIRETSPGIWQEQIVERRYFGDILANKVKTKDSEHLNPDVTIDNRLSIVADPYAYANFQSIRYVEWYGIKWQVSSVEVQRPRLILSMSQPYNEQQKQQVE